MSLWVTYSNPFVSQLRQVVMVICSYRNREFIRVGYWVANTYALPLPEGMCVTFVDCAPLPVGHWHWHGHIAPTRMAHCQSPESTAKICA